MLLSGLAHDESFQVAREISPELMDRVELSDGVPFLRGTAHAFPRDDCV
jgi:hypothetical protein